MKKVTFGIVNCNRLFYFKSCFESLVESTFDYQNKEFIVVDNASVEEGTKEYLDFLETRGVTVIRKETRNPANEFAIGLNDIVDKSTGDYICMLQGDTQFVLKNWLKEVIDFYDLNQDVVGSVMLDAQRRSRLKQNSHKIFKFQDNRLPPSCKNPFYADTSRDPVSMSADVIYSRKVLNQMGRWHVKNKNHEGGMDSENEMRYKVRSLISQKIMPQYVIAFTSVPQSVAIYTDPRGTQGRVRGNKRYGQYWEAKDETRLKYYDYLSLDEFSTDTIHSIEDIARPIGFEKPLDINGNWLKSPIRPETATQDDWVTLPERETNV